MYMHDCRGRNLICISNKPVVKWSRLTGVRLVTGEILYRTNTALVLMDLEKTYYEVNTNRLLGKIWLYTACTETGLIQLTVSLGNVRVITRLSASESVYQGSVTLCNVCLQLCRSMLTEAVMHDPRMGWGNCLTRRFSSTENHNGFLSQWREDGKFNVMWVRKYVEQNKTAFVTHAVEGYWEWK